MITHLANKWYKARYGKNINSDEKVKQNQIEDFLNISGLLPEMMGISGEYGFGVIGAMRYIASEEASLDVSDHKNVLLKKMVGSVVAELEGEQIKTILKIRNQLTTNHGRYEELRMLYTATLIIAHVGSISPRIP